MKLILFGDSHIRAIGSRLAVSSAKSTLAPICEISAAQGMGFREALHPFHKMEGNAITFNSPEVGAAFQHVSGTTSVKAGSDYVLAVSMAFTTVLLVRASCWKRWVPWDQVLPRGASPISEAVFDAIVLSYYSPALTFFADLKAIGIKVLALDSPPLQLSEQISDRAQLARTVDQRARAAIARHFGQNGIPVVQAPKQSYGVDGFLRPDLRHSDPTDDVHADAQYGVLMMPSIRTAAEQLLLRAE